MTRYFRPLAQTGAPRPCGAHPIAGGWAWFTHAERLSRTGPGEILPVSAIPAPVLRAISAPRRAILGLNWQAPRLMGILNVTPDSFSDAGRFAQAERAVAHARAMAQAGADILDIGGESTRPGAQTVPVEAEIERTAPVIAALRTEGLQTPISIDTRKAGVARAALAVGADMINDVAAFGYDSALADLVAAKAAPICLMHAQGTPETMQQAPHYENILLDVYDFLEEKLHEAEAAGIPRSRIVLDPGIGFGKTQAHNLALLRGLSLFHGLGCVLLLGVSRKRFIGTLGGADVPDRRAPGSIAVALGALAQGVQLLRVHDIAETRQALALTMAVIGKDEEQT